MHLTIGLTIHVVVLIVHCEFSGREDKCRQTACVSVSMLLLGGNGFHTWRQSGCNAL